MTESEILNSLAAFRLCRGCSARERNDKNIFMSRWLFFSVFRLSNTNFARLEIDFGELAALSRSQTARNSALQIGPGARFGLFSAGMFEQERVTIEFEIFELRIVGREICSYRRFLWVFLQKPVLPIRDRNISRPQAKSSFFAFDFVVRKLVHDEIFITPFHLTPDRNKLISTPFCGHCAAPILPSNTARPFRFPSTLGTGSRRTSKLGSPGSLHLNLHHARIKNRRIFRPAKSCSHLLRILSEPPGYFFASFRRRCALLLCANQSNDCGRNHQRTD